MQFHQNGFRAGDPHVMEAADDLHASGNEVDVLIIGCGPAGLTLATQLSAFADISVMIVDQKSGPLQLGQADGVACRTMEMFEAFNFAERVLKEAYWVNETTFWTPSAADPDQIQRSGRIQDVEDGLSEFPHVVLNQARVHDFLLDVMRNSPRRLEPAYSRKLVDLQVDPTAELPVSATFECLDSPGSEGQTVRARFAVGCDGARSTVRSAIGRTLRGDSANQAWGVMDVLAVTDFPDIRFKAVVRSAHEGNVLIIPREGGFLVRLYVEMDQLNENERVASRNISTDSLIAAAQRILHPYRLEIKEIAWWSVYEIGQRLCDRFDDASEDGTGSGIPSVFIAGDACHTHSPKAGQGMNVSMADAFNLGWKLAAVIRGLAKPQLLCTYSAERQRVAADLIDFDRHWAKRFSEPPRIGNDEGGAADATEFQIYFSDHQRYTAGVAVKYGPSLITSVGAHQDLATGLSIGARFHSAPVIRLADAKPMHLGHTLKADGRWRVFVFANAQHPASEDSRVWALCDFLADDPSSPVRAYTPAGADPDAVIDVRVIFQQGHRDLEIGDMHPFLMPMKGRYGLQDREKMFCPDLTRGEDIFDMRGISRSAGCLLIVRPDQYVADILPLEGTHALGAFFEKTLISRPCRGG
jgi:2-polyprenyl-6-methoxyphenol hydroxylase-like FAD-dependent oxidoreductase